MKKLIGKVIKIIDNSTLSVTVSISKLHPVYKKYITRSKKYLVHKNLPDVFNPGESVVLNAIAPVSKKKSYLAIKI